MEYLRIFLLGSVCCFSLIACNDANTTQSKQQIFTPDLTVNIDSSRCNNIKKSVDSVHRSST